MDLDRTYERPLSELEAIELGCTILDADRRIEADLKKARSPYPHYHLILTLRRWRKAVVRCRADWETIRYAWKDL